jgi:tol-pal system protein YbgF
VAAFLLVGPWVGLMSGLSNIGLLSRGALAPVGSAWAAAPVEESVGVSRTPTRPAAAPYGAAPPTTQSVAQGTPYGSAPATPVATAAGASASGARTGELFLQIQTLQQEVAELRGVVEELTHQVNRLASDQQTQYRDLDSRIVALRGGAPAAVVEPTSGPPLIAGGPAQPAVGAPASSGGASAAGQTSGVAPAGATGAPGEREAYSAAFELMRARKFPEATAAFERFVQGYPNSAYTANSFYWLGELHLAQNAFEPARQAFTQVINLYPDSQKMPDALYKLGVVHHRIGDVARAREFLNRVISQYPGAPAAALAQTYLTELQ